jgi:hypothetical protein
MSKKKIITYHIDAGDGELITVDLAGGLEHEGIIQSVIEANIERKDIEPDDDGVLMEITIQVKKVMTEQEVMDLPEKY